MKVAAIVRRAVLSALVVFAQSASAQGTGDGFLFRVPSWRLSLSTGFAQPRGGSDIYDFVTDELTLGRSDFSGAQVAASLAYRFRPRIEFGVSGSYAGRSAGSESRRFVGEDDLPIEQVTELHRVPVLATARLSLVSPGRAVGRFAWIPAKFVPFIGAGGGAIWYRLRQTGEFVDNETLDIFDDTFESSAWALAATGFAGADISLSPRIGFTAEGRYLWARGSMNRDFSTFNKIDLSGYDASLGFFVRF